MERSEPVARARRPSRAGASRAPRRRRPRGSSITLLVVRPDGAPPSDLDARLRTVVERYPRGVELAIASHAEAGELARWVPPEGEGLLLLRGGIVIGQLLGNDVPTREVDQAVRRAIEWPAP
jgi:hypothetical protein